MEQADVEAACSGDARDSIPPVVRSLAKEMLLYVLAWKTGDGRASFLHLRGAYRCDELQWVHLTLFMFIDVFSA